MASEVGEPWRPEHTVYGDNSLAVPGGTPIICGKPNAGTEFNYRPTATQQYNWPRRTKWVSYLGWIRWTVILRKREFRIAAVEQPVIVYVPG